MQSILLDLRYSNYTRVSSLSYALYGLLLEHTHDIQKYALLAELLVLNLINTL